MSLWAALKSVHWLVWALVAPLIFMSAYRFALGAGKRVHVVGSGALAELNESHAPEGTRYVLDLVEHEAAAQTAVRVREAIGRYPKILVFGFDEPADSLPALLLQAERAGVVPIALVPDDGSHDEVCAAGTLRLCVEGRSPFTERLAAAVNEGWERHRRWARSTQAQ